MTPSKPFWYLRNWQAWVVLAMGIVTAIVIQEPWIIALGVIGYLLVLLFDVGGGLSQLLLRLARAEQDNRALRAEHDRLVGGLKDVQAKHDALEKELAALRVAQAKPKK
jgi:hypothetical protein